LPSVGGLREVVGLVCQLRSDRGKVFESWDGLVVSSPTGAGVVIIVHVAGFPVLLVLRGLNHLRVGIFLVVVILLNHLGAIVRILGHPVDLLEIQLIPLLRNILGRQGLFG
jgi:hypothetical protein